ncbi:MAG: L,D-transpeptidase [Eubacteriales bacterium]|jgi:flagellar biosynthesis GTPase FlhF
MSRKKRKSGKKKHGRILLVSVIACAALVGGILIYGVSTGRIGASDVAADTGLQSASELEAEAKAQAEKEAAAQKAAEEAAAQKAAEEAAAKAAEEKAAQEAEAKLKAEHPEFFADIKITLPGGTVKEINQDVVKSWETENADGTYTIDEETYNQHIADFVAEIASEVDNVGSDHQFQSTNDGIQTIPGNEYYGYQVDQSAEIEQIKSELASSAEVTRKPNYTMWEVAEPDDNGGIGQTYVEINATTQHLWIYQNGEDVFETDVVTGLMDEAHYTPAGVYLLLDKQTDATLKGEKLPDGTYSYETPVSYWMPITYTGIGLHDAWWKSVFGEGQNVWNGSHGCINLPKDVAGTVYDLVTFETPIVIYYTEAYELREAPESAVDKYLREQEEAEQAAAEQAAAEQAAAEQAAAEQAAAEQAAAEQAAAEQAAAEQAAAEQAAAEQAAAEQAAAEEAAQATATPTPTPTEAAAQ